MDLNIFLDCDGVLADFDRLATELLGMNPREYEAKYGATALWDMITDYGTFFIDLPKFPGADELVQGVSEYAKPIILTGKPRGTWAIEQKLTWRDKHFPKLDMIVCKSKEKCLHKVPNGINIIIDDWPKHRSKWVDETSFWIHHESVDQSLSELKDLLCQFNLQ